MFFFNTKLYYQTEKLGNEEVKKFENFTKSYNHKPKLLSHYSYIVGGIDVFANILIPIVYAVFYAIAWPT